MLEYIDKNQGGTNQMIKVSDKTRQLAWELAEADRKYLDLHDKFVQSLKDDNEEDTIVVVPAEIRRTTISLYPFDRENRSKLSPSVVAEQLADCATIRVEPYAIGTKKLHHCYYLINGHPCLTILDR